MKIGRRAQAARPKKGVTLQSERRNLQIAFLLPLFLSLLILVLLPMASLFGLSFTNYKMTSSQFRFTGLENYINLFTDKGFRNAVKNTLFMVTFGVLIQMVLGVAAALAIQRMKHLRGLVQALIVMPMVIPPVIAGLIWRILLIPKYGGVHALLYGLGIQDAPAWLTDPVSARWVIVLVSVWEWMPFVVLFVIAALDSLPVSPFEAARIDGAGFLQELWYLTLPLIRPVLSMVLVFRVVEGLKIFPLVFSLTQGGPGNNTEELTYFAYSEGFVKFKIGYASASSMLMFGVLLVLIILFYGRKKKDAV
ncbi:sugar ABC transporter permease [Ruthenibacterium sp. CLA-JM-H11]|uniref:Sugar ABC transporter permease n=1 Tax=Ruthenibacterium intestinale TaxID=3133163 RepID=A0ABV1GDS0_9FIRM